MIWTSSLLRASRSLRLLAEADGQPGDRVGARRQLERHAAARAPAESRRCGATRLGCSIVLNAFRSGPVIVSHAEDAGRRDVSPLQRDLTLAASMSRFSISTHAWPFASSKVATTSTNGTSVVAGEVGLQAGGGDRICLGLDRGDRARVLARSEAPTRTG